MDSSQSLAPKREWDEDTILNINSHAIKWYTDGSQTVKGTGIGMYGPRTKHFENLEMYPSIFQKEIHAILEMCRVQNWQKLPEVKETR